MDDRVQRYLREFERHLRPLSPSEREDAVREIRSHMEESLQSSTEPMVLLARLGEPRALARAYVMDRTASSEIGVREMGRTLAVSLAVTGSSLTGALAVPTLLGIAVVFGLLALVSPVAGLARTFGATWIVMKFGGQDLPASWSLPVALAAGALCALVAYLALRAIPNADVRARVVWPCGRQVSPGDGSRSSVACYGKRPDRRISPGDAFTRGWA